MTSFAKCRAVFWLVLLFGSGAVIGSIVTPPAASRAGWWQARKNIEAPEKLWLERRLDNVTKRLDLTAEQQAALRPAFERAEESLRQVRESAATQTRRIVAGNTKAVLDVLNPEQREKFKALREEYRARWQQSQEVK